MPQKGRRHASGETVIELKGRNCERCRKTRY